MDGYEFLKALRRLPGGDRPKGGVLHHRERRRPHRSRASCRRQRIHHEAVRPGNRRGQVSGSRPDLIGDRVWRSCATPRRVTPTCCRRSSRRWPTAPRWARCAARCARCSGSAATHLGYVAGGWARAAFSSCRARVRSRPRPGPPAGAAITVPRLTVAPADHRGRPAHAARRARGVQHRRSGQRAHAPPAARPAGRRAGRRPLPSRASTRGPARARPAWAPPGWSPSSRWPGRSPGRRPTSSRAGASWPGSASPSRRPSGLRRRASSWCA